MRGYFQKIVILVTMILLSSPVAAQNQASLQIPQNFEECQASGGRINDYYNEGEMQSCHWSIKQEESPEQYAFCGERARAGIPNAARVYPEWKYYMEGAYHYLCSLEFHKMIKTPGQHVLQFVPMLSSDDSCIRERAVQKIHSAGKNLQEIIPNILPLLDDPRDDVQIAALQVLTRIHDKSLLKPLAAKLESPNRKVRHAASKALLANTGKIPGNFAECCGASGEISDVGIKGTKCVWGSDDRESPELFDLCRKNGGRWLHSDYFDRGYSVNSCWLTFHKPLEIPVTEYVLKSIPLLSSDNPKIRDHALDEIQSAGGEVIQDIVPQVLPLLDDPRPDVQIAALKLLAEIKDRNFRRVITPKLKSDNSDVRYAAAKALAAHNIKMDLAVFDSLLNDEDSQKRLWAASQLFEAFNYRKSLPVLVERVRIEENQSVLDVIGEDIKRMANTLGQTFYRGPPLFVELIYGKNDRARENAFYLITRWRGWYPWTTQDHRDWWERNKGRMTDQEAATFRDVRERWERNKEKAPGKVTPPEDLAGKTMDVFRQGVSESIEYDDSGKVKRVRAARSIFGYYFVWDSQWTLITIILVFLVGPIVYLIKSAGRSSLVAKYTKSELRGPLQIIFLLLLIVLVIQVLAIQHNKTEEYRRKQLHLVNFLDHFTPGIGGDKIKVSRRATVNTWDEKLTYAGIIRTDHKSSCTALTVAVEENSLDAVKVLLDNGADINARNLYYPKETALMIALKKNSFAIAKLLLERGADVNLENEDGVTALWYARNHSDLLKLLIDHGANVNAHNSKGETPLIHAVGFAGDPEDYFEVLKLLIENGADVNARDAAGRSPLLYAAQSGNAKEAEYLLSHGADINAQDKNGITALMDATFGYWRSEDKVVDTLVSFGININVKDNKGYTALDYALKRKKFKIAEKLLNLGAEYTVDNFLGDVSLYDLAAGAPDTITKFFIKNGKKIANDPVGGYPLLLRAAKANDIEMVNFLIENGADVNARPGGEPLGNFDHPVLVQIISEDRVNPSSKERLDIIRFLLEHKADPNARGYKAKTVLMCFNRHLPIVQLLIKHGADPNVFTSIGSVWKTSFIVLGVNDDRVVDELIKNKIVEEVFDNQLRLKPDLGLLKNKVQEIARGDFEKVWEIFRRAYEEVHSVYCGASPEVAQFLIDMGANVNARGPGGMTPLMTVTAGNDFAMVKLLIQNGADVHIKNEMGETALDIARGSGRFSNPLVSWWKDHRAIIDLLIQQENK